MRRILYTSLFLLFVLIHQGCSQSCNCVSCKKILSGDYAGTWISLGTESETGGCLYRNYDNRKIIRACDSASLTKTEYNSCSETGPTECIDLPTFSDFGYDSISWDGTKDIGTTARLYCAPPKEIVGYNGTQFYDLFCAAQFFPNWQGWTNSMVTTSLQMCQ